MRPMAVAFAACLVLPWTGKPQGAELRLLGQFPARAGALTSCAFDSVTGRVWVYGGSAATARAYSPAGDTAGSVRRPGEGADDVDLEFLTDTLTLGATLLPAGTLLFINGETDVADVYAMNPTTGAVLATLNTRFGASHVVGGAWHPSRRTLFLVQDNQPAADRRNRIAEIDPRTGNVIASFPIPGAFSVFYGDLEVHAASGNLLVVSSSDARIAEVTTDGALVRHLPLPAGVSSISGIGMDDARGEAWVSGTGGTVWRLGGFSR